MMDGNSFPGFANNGIKEEENMYNTWQYTTGVSNFEPEVADAEDGNKSKLDKRSDLPSVVTVSVNKICGVDTVQLQKIEEYQLDYLAAAGGLKTPWIAKGCLQRHSRDPQRREEALSCISCPAQTILAITTPWWPLVNGATARVVNAAGRARTSARPLEAH
mmetsp:Transcript_51710/g.99939  ORF Transcript_51710/g.99939 Transcript_51710/m.99939 type:complete len:161 (-) Transcript_51710:184-666(-)